MWATLTDSKESRKKGTMEKKSTRRMKKISRKPKPKNTEVHTEMSAWGRNEKRTAV